MNFTTGVPASLSNDSCVCYPVYKDGVMYNRVIAEYLGECLYTVRDYIAFGVGMSSIAFWIMCQMPQLVSNCKKKSVAALSVWFLVQWFAGDLMNLVGCFLTNQLLTQKATAMLYITMDIIVLTQYLYYAKCRKKKDTDPEEDTLSDSDGGAEQLRDPVAAGDSVERDQEAPSTLLAVALPLTLLLPMLTMDSVRGGDAASSHIAQSSQFSASVWENTGSISHGSSGDTDSLANAAIDFVADTGRRMLWFVGTGPQLSQAPPNCATASGISPTIEIVGVVIGWCSAAIYLSSRVPQVVKNIRRGSVEGLSAGMFFCTVMGNLTYGGGVLIRVSSMADVIAALPWLVGSIGTLGFDAIILSQFCYFKNRPPKRPLRLKEADDDLPRGVHNIVDWAASPWESPPETKANGDARANDLREQLLAKDGEYVDEDAKAARRAKMNRSASV